METNPERLLADLDAVNRHNTSPGRGVTRLSFSPEYLDALDYVMAEWEKIGARPGVRRGGNTVGRIPGSDPGAPPVLVGSHLDTVVNGGRFDGVAGVVCALEAARVLTEHRIAHRHPIDLAVFAEEEGSRFGSVLVGSRAWVGTLGEEQLGLLKDADGTTYAEAMAHLRLPVADDDVLGPGSLKAMLELHIEQSVVLDAQRFPVGIVESIAGIKQFLVTVAGTANHAGATPMDYRRDAMQGAARIISAVEEIAGRAGARSVATVGSVSCEPGMANVIPGKVTFAVDLRDPEPERLGALECELRRVVEATCRARGLRYEIVQRSDAAPIALSPSAVGTLERAAEARGIPSLRMVSGALHDSCVVAGIADTGMIFVPSREGRSHCPEEFTEIADIKMGADVLLDALVQLAN